MKEYVVNFHDDGLEEWYDVNETHLDRHDGPARVEPDGTKHYYNRGKRHWIYGPAVVYPDVYPEGHEKAGEPHPKAGCEEYWLDDVQYTKEQYESMEKPPPHPDDANLAWEPTPEELARQDF